ncbi:very-short-patch-repair endonuclease [Paenibacillus sp. DS2015]
MSKGERRIVNFLRQQNIVFILQATAPGLVGMGGNPLRFDFVLPTEEGRWSCVIEFDGILHSGPRDLGDGAEISLRSFKVRQEHDRRKDEWCAHNGIPLLRINHTEFNHIEDILTEEVTAN